MTAAVPPADDRMTPLVAMALAGSGIVFLLAAAGLLNGLVSPLPIPDDLRSAAVVAHLGSVLLALPLGISQLLLPKGTFRHRTVGYVWLALMTFTALVSFAIHTINPGGLSPIHFFSVLTLVFVPIIVIQARRGQVEKHRRAVLGLIIGGLAIAGLFTFLPHRALGVLVLRLIGHG
ncbi:MAG: DUF2306 domain-containing protein [Gemmatimonadota bacterium]